MRRRLGLLLSIVLVVPVAALPVNAEDDDPERAFRRTLNERYPVELRQRVAKAIDEGAKWLVERQREDGSWPGYDDSYPMGPTALATLTLLESGLDADHAAVEKAFAHLRALPMQRTYSVGLLLMALDAKYAPARDPFEVEDEHRDRYGKRSEGGDDPCEENISRADKRWMLQGVEFLLEHQNADGVWRYPRGGFDLSNTQYALLGLHAAERCGIEVPKRVWADALAFLLELQNDYGKPVVFAANEVRGRYRVAWTEKALARGFPYVAGRNATGSMTTAGLAGLVVCQTALWESRRFRDEERARTREAIRDAMAWMQVHFAVRANPVEGKRATRSHHYYYLYGLERAGILGRIRHFGAHDWFKEGAEVLLHQQRDDGGWRDVVSTCFAVLFLKRATPRMRVPAITGGSR